MQEPHEETDPLAIGQGDQAVAANSSHDPHETEGGQMIIGDREQDTDGAATNAADADGLCNRDVRLNGEAEAADGSEVTE